MKLKQLLFPNQVREILLGRHRRQQSRWLTGGGTWPIVIGLGSPNEKQTKFDSDGVRNWVTAWSSWRGKGILVWQDRRWRALGTQRLPHQLTLHRPEEVAAWVGEASEWQMVQSRYRHLVEKWPSLAQVLPKHFNVLATYAVEDIQRLEIILAWFQMNPASQLFPRQVPAEGVDSKWLEERLGLVATLFRVIGSEETESSDPLEICGLRRPPHLIRVRVLDDRLRKYTGGLSDITVPLDELAQLELPACRIFVVENLQTGLAFSDLADSVVIMRLGYSVGALASIPWLTRGNCIYWGDIDTHGFGILSQLREHFPNTISLMMDEVTLLENPKLWVKESVQHGATELPGLTPAEQTVFQGLKANRWGTNVRLEQERLGWSSAWAKVQEQCPASDRGTTSEQLIRAEVSKAAAIRNFRFNLHS